MFCTRCGTSNSDELMFCTNCSAPLSKPGDTPQSLPSRWPQEQPQQSAQEPTPPSQYQPYPGYRGSYSGEGYQPYQSSYVNQMPQPQGNASGRAITSMVLSIVSIATCGPILSIPGLILGKVEMNAIREGKAPKAGETFAKIGFYLGIAATALYCLLGLAWVAIILIGAVSNSAQ